jgi:hybrid cluster-associated redox disulfide protein
MTVTKDTIIAEILKNDPEQGCVPIFMATGMHCLGCMAAGGETVEQACAVHGLEAEPLVKQLNAYFAQKQ